MRQTQNMSYSHTAISGPGWGAKKDKTATGWANTSTNESNGAARSRSSCEAAARGGRILQNGSVAEIQQELHRRGVSLTCGAKLTMQELQKLLKLALEHEAMREQLLAASLAANLAKGLGCAVCMEDFNDNDRAPRNLSCGHSTCTQCLTSMSSRAWGSL